MRKFNTAYFRKHLSGSLRRLENVSRSKILTAKIFRGTAAKAFLVILLAATAAAVTKPAAETVFATYQASSGRKLPIYSVDVPDNKIAISFDAAWGEGY